MPRLLVLFSVFLYAHALIANEKHPVDTESQYDVMPQSISMDGIGSMGLNTDMFSPAAVAANGYRYPFAWKSPPYSMISPYYSSPAYFNHVNPLLNRMGYQPFNRYPFPGQIGMYQQFNQYQYPYRSAYMPTDSDIQFAYLMKNPQAALHYQNLI